MKPQLPRKEKNTGRRIPKRPATLAEVARLSGFSTATVSRVFNTPGKVTPKVRQRILDAAGLLHYRPNRLVSGVIEGKAPIIGVVINALRASFIPQLLGGIFQTCEKFDLSAMVYDSDGDPKKETDSLKLCIQHRLAGILLFPVDQDSHERNQILAEISELHIPNVCMMAPVGGTLEMPAVVNNDYEGAVAAVSYLIGIGHKCILHLGGSHSHYRTSEERRRGYIDAHIRAELPIYEHLNRIAGWGPPDQTRAILDELEASYPERPYTAIFAATDYTAIEALQYFYQKGIRVPDEVSVVGFGDVPTSNLACPALTTVNQDSFELGSRAARLCIGLSGLADKAIIPADPDLVVPVRLVVRNSTGPAPKREKKLSPQN